MKSKIALAALLALAACENPAEHFTERPDRGTNIVIHCPVDSLAEPKPPGMPADTACGGHRP